MSDDQNLNITVSIDGVTLKDHAGDDDEEAADQTATARQVVSATVARLGEYLASMDEDKRRRIDNAVVGMRERAAEVIRALEELLAELPYDPERVERAAVAGRRGCGATSATCRLAVYQETLWQTR